MGLTSNGREGRKDGRERDGRGKGRENHTGTFFLHFEPWT